MIMLGVPEIAVILAIVLVIFGPGKLPDLGSAIGKGLRSLRKANEEVDRVTEQAREMEKEEGRKVERIIGGTSSSGPPNAQH